MKWTRLKHHEAKALGLEIKPNGKDGRLAKYRVSDEQRHELKLLRFRMETEFSEVKRTLNSKGEIVSKVEKLAPKTLIDIPNDHVIKRVSTNVSTNQQWIITEPSKEIEDVIEKIDFDAIVAKYISTQIVQDDALIEQKSKYSGEKSNIVQDNALLNSFDRLVYTDVHIAMTTNKNGYSLYGGKWDKQELHSRLSIMIDHIKKYKKSNTLIIDELGDFMDGWDGETTRKGHKLPQNMDNEKAFDTGVWFKVSLLDNICNIYDTVICHNICEDNHAGSFGYVVNSAVKSISEAKHENVTIINLRKFISHYTIGKRCFILTHGKDSKSLKFGFKPKLDAVQVEKIKNYIDVHLLHDYNIEFSKGDSHQKLFDESTTDAFDYYNYGAFSPSSEWVQTNFKKGKSFFEFFNFDEQGLKHHHPYVFTWKVNRRDEVLNY